MRIFLAVLLTITIVGILNWTKPKAMSDLQSVPLSRVSAIQVKEMDMQPKFNMMGKLQPVRQAELRFEVTGPVLKRLVEPGQIVKEGELLLELEAGDFLDRQLEVASLLEQEQQSVKLNQSLLKLLTQKRQLQEQELKRLERLGKQSLGSQSKYDAALSTLLELKSQESELRNKEAMSSSRLQSRQASLRQAERNLQRTKLIAPFPATVNKIFYDLGDYAQLGEVAVNLVQLGELDLYLEVTGELMLMLSLGQELKVLVGDDERSGKVVAIQVDPNIETLTHAIRVRIDGTGLYAGLIASIEIPSILISQVAVVPISAVQYEEGQAYVFKLVENRLQRSLVKLLARENDWQAVKGVEVGSLVVARDAAALVDGQEVELGTVLD